MCLGAAAWVLFDRGLRAAVDDSLISMARSIALSSQRNSGNDLADTLAELFGPSFAERFYQLLDPLGRPDPRLARNRVQFPLSLKALRNAEHGNETFETITLPGVPAGAVRLLTWPVVERGRLVHLVQVAIPLERTDQARARFLLVSLTLAPLAMIAAAMGGWLLAGRALAPVDTMVAAAQRISAEDLSLRLAGEERDDELGRLAHVLNAMLARLERSFAAARQFSADAAHELRTPLTILKGEIEVTLRTAAADAPYRGALESCLEEVDRLVALIEDLLFLARADADVETMPNEPVDLVAVLADAKLGLQALAERAAVNLETRAPTHPIIVQGSAVLLFRVLFNLAENAMKYAGAGNAVEVSLQVEGSSAVLTVRDNGPGIPSAEQERIFDRFYRADPARERSGIAASGTAASGAGLGLPLARSIVHLHSGTITLESAPGNGSCFTVRLPLAAGPHPTLPR